MTYTLIPGKSHDASEEEIMSTIRSVLTEAEDAAPARGAHRAATRGGRARPVEAEPDMAPVAFVERTAQPAPRRRAADLPELEQCDPTEAGTAPRAPRLVQSRAAVVGLLGRVRGFRPTTRQIALLSLALLVVVRPHWFVISGVLAIALVVAIYLIVGSDRIWRGVLARLAYLDACDPQRAAAMRGRLDRMACRWDAILDRFPDGMVDGLYMPDLQAMQDADTAHTNAMSNRLSRMMHES